MSIETFIQKLHVLFGYKKQMRSEMFEAYLEAYAHQYAEQASNDDEYQQLLAEARHIISNEKSRRMF